MLNTRIARYCQRCGAWPVTTVSETATICDLCLVKAMLQMMRDAEPFRCPNCETLQDVPLNELFICPMCGYVEEMDD